MGATAEILERLGMEPDLVQWARSQRAELPRLWAGCPRGDWLLGLAIGVGIDRRAVVRAAADCVRMAQRALPPEEHRAVRAIHEAERWVRGEATGPECMAAAFAACTDGSEEDPVAEAIRAAAALAFGCDADADDAYYASTAYAADAVRHAAHCHPSGRIAGHRVCAELVRSHIDGADVVELVRPALRASGLPPPNLRPGGGSGVIPTGFGVDRSPFAPFDRDSEA